MSVAPNGRVDVVMIDQRGDRSGILAEAYLASSTDAGGSFHDVRLSSAPFDTRVGPTFGGNLPPDLGSHLSVVSDGNGVRASWADSRLGTDATGRQDIVMATVDVAAPGPARRPWALAAAALAVLIAISVALVGRRQPGMAQSRF
jgi:hypothetical protein